MRVKRVEKRDKLKEIRFRKGPNAENVINIAKPNRGAKVIGG